MFPLLGEGPTHTRKRKKIKQSSFLFFLFIIFPILETFLFVSGRFATVYFGACQNLKQSRTVSCVLLTEKGALSGTVHFPSNLLQIRIKHLKCKEISIACLVYTSRLFNREGINYEFLFFPPISRIYKTWQASWRQRAPRGPWNELKDFDLINHRPIFRDKEVNFFIRVVMRRNLEHFKLPTDTKDDHNKYPNK